MQKTFVTIQKKKKTKKKTRKDKRNVNDEVVYVSKFIWKHICSLCADLLPSPSLTFNLGLRKHKQFSFVPNNTTLIFIFCHSPLLTTSSHMQQLKLSRCYIEMQIFLKYFIWLWTYFLQLYLFNHFQNFFFAFIHSWLFANSTRVSVNFKWISNSYN